MAKAFAAHKMFVCIHKHYEVEDWIKFAEGNKEVLPYLAVSSGTSDRDFEKISEILKRIPEIGFLCLDIANGYSEHFAEYVSKCRAAFPDKAIMAGNVVTGE